MGSRALSKPGKSPRSEAANIVKHCRDWWICCSHVRNPNLVTLHISLLRHEDITSHCKQTAGHLLHLTWKGLGRQRVDFEKFLKVANVHSGFSVCYTNYGILLGLILFRPLTNTMKGVNSSGGYFMHLYFHCEP